MRRRKAIPRPRPGMAPPHTPPVRGGRRRMLTQNSHGLTNYSRDHQIPEYYDEDLFEIERQWTAAKSAWDDAHDAMYGEGGAQQVYDSEMDRIKSEADYSFYRDYEAEGGLLDIKESFLKDWKWPHGGESAAEGLWTTKSKAGEQYKDYVGRDDKNYAKGYGGHAAMWDKLVDRFVAHSDRLKSGYYDDEGGE